MVVVAILAVVGVTALGAGAYVGVTPGTETVTEQRYEQEIALESDVRAVVEEDSALWSEGTTLENQPAYLIRDAPEATVTATVSAGDVAVTADAIEFRLVYRAVRDDEVIWDTSSPLETTVEEADGAVRGSASVNVETVAEATREYQESVGGAARVVPVIEIESQYETDRYDGDIDAEMPIVIDDDAYELDPVATSERRTTSASVERSMSPNLPLVLALLVTGVLSLGGAAAAYRTISDHQSEAERLQIEREVRHERYAEWISHGEFPSEVEYPSVKVETLDDLVNLAVDVNGRVIYDPQRDVYTVVNDDVIYYVGERSAVEADWEFGEVGVTNR